MYYINIKNILSFKNTIRTVGREITEWEKLFITQPTGDFYPIYPNILKIIDQVFLNSQTAHLVRHFPTDFPMASKFMEVAQLM